MLAAGRELDALVAEKVMGLPIKDFRETGYQPYFSWCGEYTDIGFAPNDEPYIVTSEERAGRPQVRYIPAYSTDIAAAWEVVEKLIADGHDVELINRDEGDADRYWEMHVLEFCVERKTLPETICLAALKAVGYEPKETA